MPPTLRIQNREREYHGPLPPTAGDVLQLGGYHSFSNILFADEYGSLSDGPALLDDRRGYRFDSDEDVDIDETQHFVVARRRDVD